MTLTLPQKLEYAQLLEEKVRRRSLRKFFEMFPEDGPFRRELYPKHMEHFAKALTKPIRMFSGGNGVGKCASVTSVIQTELGPKTVGELYEAGQPFNVVSWDGAKKIIARASAPFRKPGLHHCYRIQMADGQWFDGAETHRLLLADESWSEIGSLLESGAFHPRSTADNDRSVRASGVRHWFGKLLGCLDGCWSGLRPDGGQPRFVPDSDPTWLPSPDDAQPCSRDQPCWDDPVSRYACNPFAKSPLPSRTDACRPDESRQIASSTGIPSPIGEWLFGLFQESWRLLSAPFSRLRSSCELLPQADVSSGCDRLSALPRPLVLGGNRIVSVSYVGLHEVYDFTVEGTHCYVAADMVHHNTEGVGCYEAAAHATGLYPDWWPGIKFTKATDGLVIGNTNENVRDIIQPKLIGKKGHYGTGILPGEQILHVQHRTNSNGAIDYILVRHKSGGESQINFKSYEMGSDAFMGTEKDWIWGDEAMPPDIYSECVARFRTRDPYTMFLTATPLDGVSEIITLFFPQFAQEMSEEEYETSGRALTLCSQDEVPHLTDEEKKRLQANALPHEREARRLGVPSIGSGKIYPVAEESFVISPIQLPKHWPRLYGLDVGLRVTAGVWGAWDRDTDCLYLYSEHYGREQLPPVHAAAIKARGVWIPGEIDPSARNRNPLDAESLLKRYRELGLRLHEADNAVDAGILDILVRLETGRLKVFSTLQNWLFEFRLYSRDKKGLVVKKNDHLMDATRYLNRGLAKHAIVYRPDNKAPKFEEMTFGIYG